MSSVKVTKMERPIKSDYYRELYLQYVHELWDNCTRIFELPSKLCFVNISRAMSSSCSRSGTTHVRSHEKFHITSVRKPYRLACCLLKCPSHTFDRWDPSPRYDTLYRRIFLSLRWHFRYLLRPRPGPNKSNLSVPFHNDVTQSQILSVLLI